MRTFVAQLRRELWEHPVLYIAPIVIGALLLLCSVVMMLAGLGSGSGMQAVINGIDMADPRYGEIGVTVGLLSFLPAFMLPLSVIVSFYLLDTLSAERRDRSILFFKSLPISDLATVLAKLTTALLVAPALALAALIASQIAVLVFGSAAIASVGGDAAMLWDLSRLLSVWVFATYTAVAFALWYAPTFCFLLAVSAWARRATLIWASSPLLLIFIERVMTGRSLFGELLLAHMNGFWESAFNHSFQLAIGEDQAEALLDATDIGTVPIIWTWMDPVGLVTNPTFWIGLVIAAAFTAGAVYVRRYRDDT
jgi:ABC-2 type transport system permease protein